MLVLEAFLGKFMTMADGGGRLQFDTPELTPDDGSKVMSNLRKTGVVIFKPGVQELSEEHLEAISDIDISSITEVQKSPKSLSQRFRAVLYRLWEQDNEGFVDSTDHYEHYMKRIIAHFKNKLDVEG